MSPMGTNRTTDDATAVSVGLCPGGLRPAASGAHDQMIRCTTCAGFWVYERTDITPVHPPR